MLSRIYEFIEKRWASGKKPAPACTPDSSPKGLLTQEIINGLLRGTLAGIVSPLVTIPFDYSSTNKLLQGKVPDLSSRDLLNLYKRLYPFNVLTTTFKNCSVLMLRPELKQLLQQQGLGSENANKAALLMAGLFEGGIISVIPAVIKQKMQRDTSLKTPYQAWLAIPMELRGQMLQPQVSRELLALLCFGVALCLFESS